MKKTFYFTLWSSLLLFPFISIYGSSDLDQSINSFAEAIIDTIKGDDSPTTDVDTVNIQELKQQLEDSRLNEMNLQMEIEQMKLEAYSADSLKLAHQKQTIDSLRNIVTGLPVIIEEDTLFFIYTNRGGLAPSERVIQTEEIINKLGKEYSLKPDSVFILSEEYTTDIMYENKVIISITDKDGIWMNMSRDDLSKQYRDSIVKALKELKDKNSLMRTLKRVLLFILVLVLQYILIRLTNHLYQWGRTKLDDAKNKFLKPILIKDYEFLSTKAQERIVFVLLNILRWIIIIIQLFISIPILFSIFPQTEDLAMQIFSYIWHPVKSMGISIIRYIPNLFTILVIWVVIRYIVKSIKYISNEIEQGRLKITGFYPDWASPTFNIIRFLLYAFMIAMIYPLLPGAESAAFQGLSVFVGLIAAFGSSSAIGNLIAGMIITYMRPFKIGDKIQLNDVIGNVIEKTPIVTRIQTIKNEIITIPNSTIMNSQTTNLSESARTSGLIVYLNVTIDYQTPWRQVHQLLINAAEKTSDVMQTPHPFVLEQSFDDFYVTYQINVYINDANKLSQVTSELRQNIQDVFREAGIDISSPHLFVQKETKNNS
ncbi:mechanosensitive ion channel family protein [Bacteroidales bacterium OttesenSCG-928-M06]|nr:mechanosensitive ion channel family protein [Bacteroidales bacterium OttesenSCG-928-M06]